MAAGARAKKTARKAPRCRTCGKAIRVPAGWGPGSAARKHYWAKHPEVMRPKGNR
jgi:hypothetical protein